MLYNKYKLEEVLLHLIFVSLESLDIAHFSFVRHPRSSRRITRPGRKGVKIFRQAIYESTQSFLGDRVPIEKILGSSL